MKNFVVEGCQFIITVEGVVMGEGNVEITSLASSNSKVIMGVQKKGIYAGPMSVAVSGYSDTKITGGSGSGAITPSAQHNTIDHLPVVLEGDSGTVILSGTNAETSVPISAYPVTVKVISAGQTFVKGD